MKLARKKKGDSAVVGGMAATFLTLAVIFTAIFTYASWQTQLEQRYEIDLVMHKYLTELETISRQADIDTVFGKLKAELEEHGMSGISFEDSSTTLKEPGSRIILHITGTMPVSSVTVPDDAGPAGAVTTTNDIRIDITKTGTAMY